MLALTGCSGEAITSGFSHEPEVYREDVGFDVYFCMRVVASPAEVERFVDRIFSGEERVAASPDDFFARSCRVAGFWPRNFVSSTVAYKVLQGPQGQPFESSGVVIEDGYLYFWDVGI